MTFALLDILSFLKIWIFFIENFVAISLDANDSDFKFSFYNDVELEDDEASKRCKKNKINIAKLCVQVDRPFEVM